ncbi:MAG: hypothetical protein ACTS44_01750 [Candidatus Hodgkinia cicadicola]
MLTLNRSQVTARILSRGNSSFRLSIQFPRSHVPQCKMSTLTSEVIKPPVALRVNRCPLSRVSNVP